MTHSGSLFLYVTHFSQISKTNPSSMCLKSCFLTSWPLIRSRTEANHADYCSALESRRRVTSEMPPRMFTVTTHTAWWRAVPLFCRDRNWKMLHFQHTKFATTLASGLLNATVFFLISPCAWLVWNDNAGLGQLRRRRQEEGFEKWTRWE